MTKDPQKANDENNYRKKQIIQIDDSLLSKLRIIAKKKGISIQHLIGKIIRAFIRKK